MTCDELHPEWPAYWAGTLSPAARAGVEAHLAACEACRAEAKALEALWRELGALPDEAPSPSLQARFDAMLAAWQEGAATARVLAFDRPASRVTRWAPAFLAAAAVLLVVTGFVAGRLVPDRDADRQVSEMRGELRSMREMVAVSLLQQSSAAERLRGVTWSQRINAPGDEVVSALLDALKHDANVNVRLAAIDALKGFDESDRVREGLIDAVGRQSSPLVQIQLIDALVELREGRSRAALKALVESQQTERAVRERARWGLEQLG